ncbi:hypothetical protein, partial [Microbacterium oxydans]|uniref:hypothetical protein n=1 Tax=Microbacterium oxydans TaxID=82380 RepID=UPI001E5FE928
PSAVADDWATPTVAPEVPSSGGYRGLTVAIFTFLLILLVAAVGVGIFLATTTTFPFGAGPAVDVTAQIVGGVLPL